MFLRLPDMYLQSFLGRGGGPAHPRLQVNEEGKHDAGSVLQSSQMTSDTCRRGEARPLDPDLADS